MIDLSCAVVCGKALNALLFDEFFKQMFERLNDMINNVSKMTVPTPRLLMPI